MNMFSSSWIWCKYLIVFCLWLSTSLCAVGNANFVAYPAKIFSKCGLGKTLQNDELITVLKNSQQAVLKENFNRSCHDIFNRYPSVSSGYYQIQLVNGSDAQVYCDMEGVHCGGEGGWMRVAFVNMSQAGSTCPIGLHYRNISNLPFCGRTMVECQTSVFPTLGLNYSQVCGQIRGYQYGVPRAFVSYNFNSSITIDDNYVDGASITYGSNPRKHIWTYANGEGEHSGGEDTCPCNSGSSVIIPPFVGQDYYCESGIPDDFRHYLYYRDHLSNDTLWDGEQCNGVESPCCANPNMPWFVKHLAESTNEQLEIRLCSEQISNDNDVLIEVIELLVK